MKRKLLVLVAAAMCMASYAQKTVIKTESFSHTQARMVDATTKSYARPLIVDLKVEKSQGRKKFQHNYSREEVEVALGGDLDNVRSRALYDAAEEWQCDAVVVPTFKVELTEDGKFYSVEMKGFAANFDPASWHSISEQDYEWLKIEKLYNDKLDDPDRAGAIIRNVKKAQ